MPRPKSKSKPSTSKRTTSKRKRVTVRHNTKPPARLDTMWFTIQYIDDAGVTHTYPGTHCGEAAMGIASELGRAGYCVVYNRIGS